MKKRQKDSAAFESEQGCFDEATGTVTLTLATDKEIAEDERLKRKD